MDSSSPTFSLSSLCLALAGATPSAAAAAASLTTLAGLNLGACLQPELAFRDDRLAGRETLFNHHIVVDAQADRDRLLIDGSVGLDDEHELTVLACLNGLARQHHRVRDRPHAKADAGELARPQAVL